jgi:hypothetical protein
VIQPLKKPKGKELTKEQKQENKAKSSVRVVVEHAIGRVKICRIVKDKIRLWKPRIKDKVMQLCCGLHNFRLSAALTS